LFCCDRQAVIIYFDLYTAVDVLGADNYAAILAAVLYGITYKVIGHDLQEIGVCIDLYILLYLI